MHVELLAPANLFCLLALMPLGLVFVRVRARGRRAALALGLRSGMLARAGIVFAASAGALSLLALAASKPVAWTDDRLAARTDAEAYVVVDTSVSMLGRRSLRSPTRIAAARSVFARLVQRLPRDLPVGLAVMPQSLLPILGPTVDRGALQDVGGQVLFAGRMPTKAVPPPPPPGVGSPAASSAPTSPPAPKVATNFTALEALALAPFYARGAPRRLAILVTDGESAPFPAAGVQHLLRRSHIRLLVVRVGGPHDRLWRTLGGKRRLDPGYRPALEGVAPLGRLASSLGGHGLYREDDLPQVLEQARRLIGNGPTRHVGGVRDPVPLGRYAALAAVPLLAFAVAPLLPAPPGRPDIRRLLRTSRIGVKRAAEDGP